jgi:hypothetical protein
VQDVDWETKYGRDRVRLSGEWVVLPDVAVVVPDVAVVTQLRLSAIFAVALIFFSDVVGAAPSSLPFSDCPLFLTFLDFLNVVILVNRGFLLPWFCHRLSFCCHRHSKIRDAHWTHTICPLVHGLSFVLGAVSSLNNSG